MGLEHVLPTSVTIDCSGARHTLLWRQGRLETQDHADPEAERSLAALGGEPCRCIELLDAWERCTGDLRALVLGPRGPSVSVSAGTANAGRVRLGPQRGTVSTRRSGVIRSVQGRPAQAEPARDPLFELLCLGGVIPQRLVATVAGNLAAGITDATLVPELEAALYGRVLATLSRWLGESPELRLTVIAPGARPSLTRDDGGLTARLPFAWIVDVWAPGLDIVAGRFTLAADSDAAGCRLLTVDPLLTVNTCTLSFSDENP